MAVMPVSEVDARAAAQTGWQPPATDRRVTPAAGGWQPPATDRRVESQAQPAAPQGPTPQELAQQIQARQRELTSQWASMTPEDRLLAARELGQLHATGINLGNMNVGEDIHAAVLNAGEGLFGLGSRVGAAVDFIGQMFGGGADEGQQFTYNEFLEYRRGQAQGAWQANPVAGTVGYLGGLAAGVVGPGSLAVRGAAAAAPAAVVRAATPVAGQTAANIGRLVAAGATGAAVQSLGEAQVAPGEIASTRGLGSAVLAGAIAGPVARGAIVAGGRIVNRVTSAFGGQATTTAAMRRIASTVKRPGESLADAAGRVRAAAAEFQQAHGRLPAVNELIDAIDDPALRRVAEMTETGSRRATELGQTQMRGAPAELSRGVAGEGRRVATPAETVANRQRTEFKRMIDTHGNQQIRLTPGVIDIIKDPDFARIAIARGQDDVAIALRQVAEGKLQSIPLRVLDEARQRLAKVIGSMSPSDVNYSVLKNMRNELRALGEGAVPEYARAMQAFATRGDIQAGIKVGQQIASDADSAVTRAAIDNATPAERLGIRLGARSAVRRIVGTDPGGATNSIRRIAEDVGLQRRLAAALGPDEAQAMIEAARAADRAFRARGATIPGAGAARDNIAQLMRTALEAGVLPTGRGGGGWAVNVLSKMLDRLQLSRATRKRIVDMAYDPDKFVQVLAFLEAHGVTPGAFDRAIRQAAVAGQLAGQDPETAGVLGAGAGILAAKAAGGVIRSAGQLVGIGREQPQ